MKNKILIILILFMILGTVLVKTTKAGEGDHDESQESAARKAIESLEESVLGSEKHAELEEVEPAIDEAIKKYTPIAIGVLVLVGGALYFKSKRNRA